jgi:hypothetical protein
MKHLGIKALASASLMVASWMMTGCSPIVFAASSPPVKTEAELQRPVFENNRIELTRGVALALDCREPWFGQPCDDMKVQTDDPSIATAHIAYLEKYRSDWGYVYEEGRQRSALVLAARAPGRTVLRIHSDDGDAMLEVIVNE